MLIAHSNKMCRINLTMDRTKAKGDSNAAQERQEWSYIAVNIITHQFQMRSISAQWPLCAYLHSNQGSAPKVNLFESPMKGVDGDGRGQHMSKLFRLQMYIKFRAEHRLFEKMTKFWFQLKERHSSTLAFIHKALAVQPYRRTPIEGTKIKYFS